MVLICSNRLHLYTGFHWISRNLFVGDGLHPARKSRSMPGVRESGKNWAFSTFQADEKLGAGNKGWNSGVVGFLHVCCINT